MARATLIVCWFVLASIASPLAADQEVTLKSGTRLIGKAAIRGDMVAVAIGDASVEVPLSNVAVIAPVGAATGETPERLLLIALESQLQQHSGEAVVGILAEAARLAPRDPRIAFWYASSLVDAGHGRAAQEVLQAHGQAISKAYPGLADGLMARIRERAAFESLPRELITRIDEADAAAKASSLGDELRLFVRFHVVDQQGRPVDKSALHIDGYANNERLEDFGDGYFLFAMTRNSNSMDQACTLTIDGPGYEKKQVDLRLAVGRVSDSGNIMVQRYADKDKRPVRFRVVDRKMKPLAGAIVTVSPLNERGARQIEFSATTDDDGRAELQVFPGDYRYNVQAKGYGTESTGLSVLATGAPPAGQGVKLFRLVTAMVRVEWTATSPQGNGVTTHGESVVQLGQGIPQLPPNDPNGPTFLRAMQSKDQLLLQLGLYPGMMMGPNGAAPPMWARQAPPEDEDADAARERFAAIDLKKVDELQKTYAAVELSPDSRRGPMGMLMVPLKQGAIYVGQIPHRSMYSGGFTSVSFKILVEELTTDDDAEDGEK